MEPLRILIVDDNKEDRYAYRRYLDADPSCEYAYTEAADGERALATCRVALPDCILLDYNMPGMDGFEFLQRLDAELGPLCLPVIMLTGEGNEVLAAEALKSGALDYMPKSSASTSSLSRAVDNATKKHRLEVELAEHRADLERTNAHLKRRNEEISRFYHSLSHELKTPLTSAREFVTLLLDGCAGPLSEQQQEYLGYAKSSCDRMTVYIDDILDTTRLETGKFRVTPCVTDLGALAEEMILSMQPCAREAGIALEIHVEAELPEVFVDPHRIAQVLSNLISNGIRYTEEGGRVEVRAFTSEPDVVAVAVTDTGCGIEADDLQRVFDRLYQVDNVEEAETDIRSGLGLGLHIARELARLHGGDLQVESEPGVGSTFRLTLPTCAAERRDDAAA